jgi:predicted SnoaL-like aldol condensation-catalyzing enzyme
MKKIIFSMLALSLMAGGGFCQEKIDEKAKMSIEENKKISTIYHDLNPDNVDKILTEDFIGRSKDQDRHNWDREQHRGFLNNHPEAEDKIYSQIGEGDWVATRFTRTMNYQGKNVKIEMMNFKRFQNGKIAEIREYFDWKQLEEEVE